MTLVLIVATCTACADEGAWRHRQHNDAARFETDARICEDLSTNVPFYRGLDVAHHQARVHDAFMQCMYRLGYYRAPRSAGPAMK